MKSVGIVRKLDDLNRITIPKEFEVSLNLEKRQPLEIWVDGETILLKKYEPNNKCIFCGSGDKLVKHVGRDVCQNCIRTMMLHNRG